MQIREVEKFLFWPFFDFLTSLALLWLFYSMAKSDRAGSTGKDLKARARKEKLKSKLILSTDHKIDNV